MSDSSFQSSMSSSLDTRISFALHLWSSICKGSSDQTSVVAKKTFLIFSCNCQKISLALKALLWIRLFKTTLPLFDRCRRRRWRRRRKGHGINGRRPTRPVPALGTPVVTIESIQRSGTDQLDLDATALVFYRTSRPHGLTSQIWEILMGLSSSVYSSLVPLESWS